jgi:Lyase
MNSAANLQQHNFRVESDSLGEVNVPTSKLWGAQTQRSLEHFSIGNDLIPREMIAAYATLKKAAANANHAGGRLDDKRHNLIVEVCDEILSGQHEDMFPLHVWMTGSGTQFNMNVNEVISNRCCQLAGTPLGSKTPVHPNDHVNMSQSSNDSFPTAMNIAAAVNVKERLIPAVTALRDAIVANAEQWKDIVKIGRTHMQDATPLTLGQEWSGYAGVLTDDLERIEDTLKGVYRLALGGTAVGTGINAAPDFGDTAAAEIAKLSNLSFISLNTKGQATRPVLEGLAANISPEAIGPVAIRKECTHNRTAEEFPARANLRRDCHLAEPTVVAGLIGIAVRVIEASLDRQRNILIEEDLGSRSERYTLVPPVFRIAVLSSLQNEDRHDCELIVWLVQHLLDNKELCAVIEEGACWLDSSSTAGRAEVARRACTVLDGQRVISTLPFQPLMTESEGISVACRNGDTGVCGTAFQGCIVEPCGPLAERPLDVVESRIDVALRQSSVLCDEIRTSCVEECDSKFAHVDVQVLYSSAVAAEVQRIEVVNLDMLSAIVAFTGPHFGAWLPCKEVASFHKSLSETELIIADATGEICVAL